MVTVGHLRRDIGSAVAGDSTIRRVATLEAARTNGENSVGR
jgi:hypothetical protein